MIDLSDASARADPCTSGCNGATYVENPADMLVDDAAGVSASTQPRPSSSSRERARRRCSGPVMFSLEGSNDGGATWADTTAWLRDMLHAMTAERRAWTG